MVDTNSAIISASVLQHLQSMNEKYDRDREARLALAFGMVETGLPLKIKGVPVNSPVIEAVRLAYEGRGLVLIHPTADRRSVSISAYPTSVRGVSALASDVFHNGFKNIAPCYRVNV